MKKILLGDNEEWLKNREVGIGGSDCACIEKLVEYMKQNDIEYRAL